MSQREKYTYSKARFKDRETVLTKTEELITALQKGDASVRAIILSGVRGSGKSWLSLHLARDRFAGCPDVIPFLIRLWPIKDEEQPAEGEWWLSEFDTDVNEDSGVLANRAVADIIGKLAVKLEQPPLAQSPLEDRSHNLAIGVSSLKDNKVLLLILDSAFEGPQGKYARLLEELQNYLITPLLQTKRTLVVITGRGSPPTWDSTYLRDAHKRSLLGFRNEKDQKVDRKIIEEILAEHSSPFAGQVEAVCELSDGYPLTVRLIAKSKACDLESALDEAIAGLLEIIPNDQNQREKLRGALEQLSVLEKPFHEEEIVPFMEPELEYELGLKRVQEIRDWLMTYYIMEWITTDQTTSGYVINESIIIPIRYYLKHFKNITYRDYCARAVDRFKSLAKQFSNIPDTAQYYNQLVDIYNEDLLPQKGGSK